MQQGLLLFKRFMGAITGSSLVVGGVGIMNVLLALWPCIRARSGSARGGSTRP